MSATLKTLQQEEPTIAERKRRNLVELRAMLVREPYMAEFECYCDDLHHGHTLGDHKR